MFKKIMIALMAVTVFAIPMGVSAFSEDYVYTGSTVSAGGYSNLTTTRVTSTNLPPIPNGAKGVISYTSSNGYTGLMSFSSSTSVIDFTESQYGTRYLLSKKSDGTLTWTTVQSHYMDSAYMSSFSGADILYSNFKAVQGDTVFFTNVEPPPPPKPVTIQAVKTVEEIVPQTATVAGGIVLVVSILLGVWLLVGLVKRLTYSFLR